MGSQVIPPLPPGFTLDQGEMPPLPPGFTLDAAAPDTRPLVDQIPGNPQPRTATPAAPDSRPWLQRHVTAPLRSSINTIVEPALTMGSGLLGMGAGTLAGVGKEVLTGDFGKGTAQNTASKIQEAITYQPRDPNARAALEGVVKAFEVSKLPPMPGVTGLPAAAMRGIVPQVAGAVTARKALKGEQAANASRLNAPKIEAFDAAKRLGIAVDPVTINPTMSNKVGRSVAGGSNLDVVLANKNEPIWASQAKSEIGIAPDKPIRHDTIAAAKESAAKGSTDVSRIGVIADDGATASEINALLTDPLIGGKAAHDKIGKLVTDATTRVSGGMDASEVLRNISQLRKDARTIYATADAGRKKLAVADTSMGIANALESMIDRHLAKSGQSDLMNAYRNDRQKMAKIYTVEGATNLDTGVLDPNVIAKMTRKDTAISGKLRDIGLVVNNFPEVSKIGAKTPESAHPHLTRTGIGGTVGLGVGLVAGSPGLGMLGGAAAGRLAEAVLSRRVASPGYQSKIKIPDARPMREQLGYGKGPMAPEPVQMTNPTRGEFQLNADAVRRAEIDAVLQAGAASRANSPVNALAAQEAARQAANVEAAQQAGLSRGAGAPNRASIEQAIKRAEIDAVLQAGAASRARNQRSNKP